MELRLAIMDDAKFLFELRNDSETVKQSQNRSPVIWEGHLEWLSAVIRSPSRWLYVVKVDEMQVGTGRLDQMENDVVELSVAVAPDARGKGVAKKIIAALKEQATEMGFPTQIAHVRENNVGSMIAFLKAGFVPTSNRIVMMTLKS